MKPSEIRTRILAEHRLIESQLERVLELAVACVGGEPEADRRLARAVAEMAGVLREHMALEERELVPVVRELDAWGRERVALILADHAEQREALGRIGGQIENLACGPLVLADEVRALAKAIAEDIRREERGVLSDTVLRDDLVSCDQSDG